MSNRLTINADQIMMHEPCDRWPRERVERVVVGDVPFVDFLRNKEIPAKDRAWVAAIFYPQHKRDIIRVALEALYSFSGSFQYPSGKKITKTLIEVVEDTLHAENERFDGEVRHLIRLGRIIDRAEVVGYRLYPLVARSIYGAVYGQPTKKGQSIVLEAFAKVVEERDG